jgi:hypothetical protein
MKRASIKLAIYLAILLGAAQSGARAESIQAWSRQFNVTYITGMRDRAKQLYSRLESIGDSCLVYRN